MKKTPEIEQTSAADGQADKKQPYTRPVIVYREFLEATAAACSPSPPGKAAGPCAAPSS